MTQQLLGEDLSVDTQTCDEVIDAIQAIHAGRAASADFAWDATQLVVAVGTSRVRPAARAGSVEWVEVPTRELYDALLELRAFIAQA